MNDPIKRAVWENLVEKHKDILISPDEKWYKNLDELEKYIIEHIKKPVISVKDRIENQLAIFLQKQQQNYKKYIKSMRDRNKRTEWEKFVNKYTQILLNNDEKWHKNMNDLNEWTITNKKRPITRSDDMTEKRLSIFFSHTQKDYNKWGFPIISL